MNAGEKPFMKHSPCDSIIGHLLVLGSNTTEPIPVQVHSEPKMAVVHATS